MSVIDLETMMPVPETLPSVVQAVHEQSLGVDLLRGQVEYARYVGMPAVAMGPGIDWASVTETSDYDQIAHLDWESPIALPDAELALRHAEGRYNLLHEQVAEQVAYLAVAGRCLTARTLYRDERFIFSPLQNNGDVGEPTEVVAVASGFCLDLVFKPGDLSPMLHMRGPDRNGIDCRISVPVLDDLHRPAILLNDFNE